VVDIKTVSARECFSALQRAEIAETSGVACARHSRRVSVLFNEPKLLKPALPAASLSR